MGVSLIEAVRPDGSDQTVAPSAWRVKLIKAGTSKNRNRYSLKTLHEAVPLYEGVRALSRADDEHSSGRGKNARNVVGWFTGAEAAADGIDATFNISEAAGWLKTMLWDAWGRGKKDIVGFSHVADAAAVFVRTAEGMVRDVQKITKIDFVDVVVDPSAGGEIVGLAESENEGRSQIMLMEKLLKLIEALSPERFKAIDVTNVTEAQVAEILEAIQKDKATTTTTPAPTGDTSLAQVTEALKSVRDEIANVGKSARDQIARDRAVLLTEALVAQSDLPEEAMERILAKVNGSAEPATKTEIEKFIAAEAKYLGVTRGWKGPGSSSHNVVVRRDELDKWKAGLDGLVANVDKVKLSEAQGDTIDSYHSLKDAYLDRTGDREFTGEGFHRRFAEATIGTSTFAGALGDSIRRKMQAEYAQAPFSEWKKIANVVSVPDFRANVRPQMGGFSSLPDVLADGQYVAFTTEPGEFSPSYSVIKRGATQVVTMETIVNDDIGAIQRLPIKMARAAARTLNGKVWAPILTNAIVGALGGTGAGGSDVLFIASTKRGSTAAGNFSTTATLSQPNIIAGRVLMMKQTEQGSAEKMNIGPRYLCVGVDQENLAYELCGAALQPTLNNIAAGAATDSPNRPNFIQRFGLEPITVPHMTDANDWFLIADPKDIPTIEVGFLGGRQEPELFVADQPTSDVAGAGNFTYDRIVYKERHIYGVGVMDFRGFYGAILP